MRTLQNISFWKKFSHYLLIGLSALVLFAGIQSGMVGDFTQRGPDAVFANIEGYGQVQSPPAPTCSVRPEEYPQCGGTAGLEGEDPTHTFIVTKFVDCNGNVAAPYAKRDLGNLGQCAALPLPQPQPQPQPLPGTQTQPTCTEVRNTPYGQCGGTVGLEGRDPTHQFEVVRITDSCTGGILRYEVTRDAGPAEACGFQPAPPPSSTVVSRVDSDPSHCGASDRNRYRNGQRTGITCTGTWISGETFCNGDSENLYYYTSCGPEAPPPSVSTTTPTTPTTAAPATTTTTTPVSTCGRQEVNEGCVDNSFRSFRTIDTCSGFSSGRRVWDPVCASTTFDGCQEFVVASFCSSQSSRTERVRNTCDGMGEFTRTVWDSNCGFFQSPFFQSPFCTPTEIFSSDTCVGSGTRERVFTNSCTGGEMRRERFFDGNCLVRGSVVTQQPAVVRFATLDAVCPAGSTKTVEGNVVTCTVTAPTTFGNVGVARVVTAQAPAVAGVRELPKTGLPLLAWAALAFIPAGLKIRGFSKVKMETAAKPHFLYEERQFKTNLDN